MAKAEADKKTFSQFFRENIPYIIGIIFAIANLYLLNLLSPLKQDIRALATQVDSIQGQVRDIQSDGTVQSKLNEQSIKNIDEKVGDIKDSLLRLEEKLDRYQK